ncbi:glycosyltransferase [Phytohabitans sp. ZYX-F-186]|uniref:Glycosyltransferase n=1 Tax=Phytohabitans maris TaxID=3071409 RepID=A0ABU0ZVC1_9ACTN|nr:glycosyltransferase [Phytohabitans sp. ZYX-F-186]MDQ7910984.1 glycosyltransferase [Phytohabitans sp. ZYX-F-186]
MNHLFLFTSVTAFVMGGMFVGYLGALLVPYLTQRRGASGDPGRYEWHFFIPCRDEEAVIGGTIANLRSQFRHAHVWVADDASTDRTADKVQAIADTDSHVHLRRRVLPDARTGKSDALNALYRDLDDWLPPEIDRTSAIVCVVDADGRLRGDCLEAVTGPRRFGDARVAAVQVGVRMMNRTDRHPLAAQRPKAGRLRSAFARLLVRMQDLEFQGPILALQLARRHSRTVGMGGNGQFTRMSALDAVAGDDRRPWHGSLLEDFELGVHLLLRGYRTAFAHDTWVDQEGLPRLDRLITQRTRWSQGNMLCIKYLPAVWRNPALTNLGAIEVAYFLLQPWLQLVGTFVYALPVIAFGVVAVVHPDLVFGAATADAWLTWTVLMALGIGQFALWGPIYVLKVERTARLRQGIGWGLSYAAYVLLFYVTAWRAFVRILRGKHGWSKTRRNAETGGATVAVEA